VLIFVKNSDGGLRMKRTFPVVKEESETYRKK
jgi:hypothetical protein